MKTDEILKLLSEKELIDKIYNWAYHRCNASYQAEDLCQDIILNVLSSLRKKESVDNFYAYLWTVAHRVYADFCQRRAGESVNISLENCEMQFPDDSAVDGFIEEEEQKKQIADILREIAFLSKAYRQVMIMYYLDQMKISDIAKELDIKETTVKQRLFSARKTVKKEVEKMNDRNLTLKPCSLDFAGTGDPIGNDPSTVAQRTLAQNIIYLCAQSPKSVKELSDLLCVPMIYIEEEVEIQCRGVNGTYGTLHRLDNGKYVNNIMVVDTKEIEEANSIILRHLPKIAEKIKEYVEKNKDALLSFPYLSKQDDVGYILWSFIHTCDWRLVSKIANEVSKKYFADVPPSNHTYTSVANIVGENGVGIADEFFGCDGIGGQFVCGYSNLFATNVYGRFPGFDMPKHFSCGANISNDASLQLALRSIGGLPVSSLTESEKEAAAKAIEHGYIKRVGDTLEPKIVIVNMKDSYMLSNLFSDYIDEIEDIISDVAAELADYIKAHLPAHLENEHKMYVGLVATVKLLPKLVKELIAQNILPVPTSSEGVFMSVEK